MDVRCEQDYDFDYEDDDQEDVDADVENKYYQAKNLRSDHPEKALTEWRSIIDGESPKAEWGFKALKQSTKLNFRRQRYEEALKVRAMCETGSGSNYDAHIAHDCPCFGGLQTYTELLGYTRSAVTRNASEKSINGILDYVSAAQDLDTGLMQRWYEVTQQALEEAKNEVRDLSLSLFSSKPLASGRFERHD